ncbi:Sec-independent protein translocase TatB [Cellulomonas sp. PhB150]|uniref:Sec-independent protein translocase TatB n=1 Tax=Cellulomonas sp. PhB150 TaxID=2485188 RepID=UPI000F9C8B92|nr:Sec-independent protein translocase TatB [Cellulomonas sp. PhB150]ROS23096.1 sec-independent protein translocase protein TatB [Cellulomonas sp. PhB150]
MLFDINGGEFLVLLLVAAIVIGPQRLPGYAEQLGALVRKARIWMKDAKGRIDTEMGDDAIDLDWTTLDPRRYDPRRIVRDALLEPDARQVPAAGRVAAVAAPVSGAAPFDDEAT